MSMDAITAPRQGNIQMIDSTSVRAHQPAATAKEGGIEIKLRVEQAAAHPISPVSNDKILEALDVNVCCVLHRRAVARVLGSLVSTLRTRPGSAIDHDIK
jgi:hypothetical protein